MAKRDYYEVMGVLRGATDDEIRTAFRRRARQYHPDLNPGDKQAEQKFKELGEANEVLSDPEKRKRYDRFGHEGLRAGAQPGQGPGRGPGPQGYRYTWSGEGSPFDDAAFEAFGGGGGPGGGDTASVFEEIFSRLGGQGGRRGGRGGRRASRGQDFQTELNLTFEQSVHGGETAILTERPAPDGSIRPERLTVHIPSGVEDGQRLRLRGKGAPGPGGGPAGDLYLTVHVQPHAYFRREGRDVYLDLPIGVAEAALGTKVDVPTVRGRGTVRIPPGTASGAKLRLKGQGIPDARGGAAGDQYCVIRIVPPKTLTDSQKALYEQLRTAETENPRAGLPWNQ